MFLPGKYLTLFITMLTLSSKRSWWFFRVQRKANILRKLSATIATHGTQFVPVIYNERLTHACGEHDKREGRTGACKDAN